MEKTNSRVDRAKVLLKSPAYLGDHGFTGKQLEVWTHQRAAHLACLWSIANGGEPTYEQLMVLQGAVCPRESTPRWKMERVNTPHTVFCASCDTVVEHAGDVTREVANTEWSSGTPEGANWVESSRKCIYNS